MTVSLDQLRRCHVAVDLGAARTRVFVKGAGLVVDEPSVAAVNTRTGALIAVGALAEKMTGRTPDYIRVMRPVSGGTVVDIEMAQRMLRHLLGEKLRRQLRRKPRLRAAADGKDRHAPERADHEHEPPGRVLRATKGHEQSDDRERECGRHERE